MTGRGAFQISLNKKVLEDKTAFSSSQRSPAAQAGQLILIYYRRRLNSHEFVRRLAVGTVERGRCTGWHIAI